MIDFLNRFVASLSDAEVSYLEKVILVESDRRAKERWHKNQYPELDDQEKKAIQEGSESIAVHSYCIRTGVQQREARYVVRGFRVSLSKVVPLHSIKK